MEIVIFTLPINVNNKSHDYVAHFPRIQTCMLKKRDVAVNQRRYDVILFDAPIVEMCKLNRNVMQTSRT